MTGLVQAATPPPSLARRIPFYFGWVQVALAALAMVGTLPGRTQGLGLVTEPLLADLGLSRLTYAEINLWATLVGSAACLGFGALLDRWGTRWVLAGVAAGLGVVVLGMAQVGGLAGLAIGITLTRALGQSALSVASLNLTPQWFSARLPQAMAAYSVLLSVGFMIAFPIVGGMVVSHGWRTAWTVVGLLLLAVLAPLAALLVRTSPESCGLTPDARAAEESAEAEARSPRTLAEALASPTFWVFALGSTLYGLVASGIGIFNEAILRERGFPAGAYHQALVITALTALLGNFAGGWLAARWSLPRLMALAMGLLGAGLFALPHLTTRLQLWGQAVLMGVAGGLVTVLFFMVWRREFGREHLGRIQGAAQTLTVLGSAVGPLVLARVVEATGSYTPAFRGLGVAVLVLGLAALACRREPAADPQRLRQPRDR